MPDLTTLLQNMKSYMPMTKQFEGYRDSVYNDTEGNPTIGYGFNLNDKNMADELRRMGWTGGKLEQGLADKLFEKRYYGAVNDASAFVGSDVYGSLTPQRQAILNDMAYNMGADSLAKFKEFKKALVSGDYNKAAREMKDSDWYSQVGNRSKALIKMMKEN